MINWKIQIIFGHVTNLHPSKTALKSWLNFKRAYFVSTSFVFTIRIPSAYRCDEKHWIIPSRRGGWRSRTQCWFWLRFIWFKVLRLSSSRRFVSRSMIHGLVFPRKKARDKLFCTWIKCHSYLLLKNLVFCNFCLCTVHFYYNVKILLPTNAPFIYLLTYSMEQSPSWEANWFCS